MTGLHGVQALFDGEPELVPGALAGYRCWSGFGLTGGLQSLGMRHEWEPAPFDGGAEVARCLGFPRADRPDHESPGRDCACGLYGWYDPADDRITPGAIFGAVRAGGRLVMGTHGFRAQRLEVLGLVTGWPEMHAQAEQLGFRVFDTRRALLEAFPPDDVSGLVDHECGPRCEAQTLVAGVVGAHAAHLHVSLVASVAAFEDAMKRAAQVAQQVGISVQAFLDGVATAEGEEPDVRTLRQRALDAVRNRGTGPRPVPFAKRVRP